MKRVLVTGANGFVAAGLCPYLLQRDYLVRGAVRSVTEGVSQPCDDLVVTGDLAADPQWRRALTGVDAVVHLAALVEPSAKTHSAALARYREVNTRASEQLARVAAEHGVRRLVFLSSIKVNGEATGPRAFASADPAAPVDLYAVSKYEAEEALMQVARETGMELVIVRPPLVYGPGVKGNFRRLMGLVSRGVPLPFAGIRNRRSMLGLGNLCELLELCLEHPAAAGQLLLAADDEVLSTPDLVRSLASAMRKPARLIWAPERLLTVAGRITGHSEELARLCHSLVVDTSATRRLLDWAPARSAAAGVEEVARWYLKTIGKPGFD